MKNEDAADKRYTSMRLTRREICWRDLKPGQKYRISTSMGGGESFMLLWMFTSVSAERDLAYVPVLKVINQTW